MYTGREFSPFGFYEYRARAYHPGLGRFTSEDPKLFDAGDYNLFRYCDNDPIDMTDPMGTEDQNKTGFSPLDNAGAAGAMQRLWDMTRWFDRSNIIQGNFPGFTLAMTSQSNQNAQGGNFFSRLVRSIGRLFGRNQAAAAAGASGQSRTILRSGNLRIDTDGSGSDHGDPTHVNETAYQPNGRSLNADTDPYVAVPTSLLRQGVRVGDRAVLSVNGRSAPGVVGDTGATPGLIEASFRLVHDVGIRTQDARGVGPVPGTPGEVPAAMTLYPGGN